MNVVFNPTGYLWDRSQSPNRTTEVLVQERAPFWFDQRPAVFGADDDMMM